MKTKSRILKTATMSAILIILFIFSCSLLQQCQKIETDFEYNLEIPDVYNEVGKMHNEGLDYTLAEIQNKCIQYSSSNIGDPIRKKSIDYSTIAKEAMIDFFRENPRTKDSFSLFEGSLVESGYILKSGNVKELKPKQRELMNEIQLAVKSEFRSKNVKRLKGKLDMVNKKALADLPEVDAAPIYCATSTAYSTFQYWIQNYRAWYFALHYPELLSLYDRDELNKLKLKGSTISLDTITLRPDYTKTTWDYLEGWIDVFTDSIDKWWDTYGEAILISDCVGAVDGGGTALATAGAGALVFGPDGLVVVGVAGAIVGSVESSVQATIVSGIIEAGKE